MSQGGYEPVISPQTILFVKNLKVYFPVRRGLTDVLFRRPPLYVKAVDGVSFEVRKGEVFTLAGESGCGKTTTGKAILRLVDPTEGVIGYLPSKSVIEELEKTGSIKTVSEHGHIDIASLDEKSLKPLRKDMQMIWQDPYGSLNPRRTIY